MAIYTTFLNFFFDTQTTAEGIILITIGGIIISLITLIGCFRLFFVIGKLIAGK